MADTSSKTRKATFSVMARNLCTKPFLPQEPEDSAENSSKSRRRWRMYDVQRYPVWEEWNQQPGPASKEALGSSNGTAGAVPPPPTGRLAVRQGCHSGARPRGSCSVSPRTVLTERCLPAAASQHPSPLHRVPRLAGNGERGSWNRSPSRGMEDEVTLWISIITVDLFSTSD